MKLNKYILYVVGMLLLFPVMNAAEPLINSKDTHLQTLVTDSKPAIYLMDSSMRVHGTHPVVLNVDAASVKMLSEVEEAFGSVELIRFKLKSAKDETAKIDLTQLNAFTNLKYLLVLYEYEACGDGDACLADKVNATITMPENSDVEVYYLLSVPK